MKTSISLIAILAAVPALAEDKRQLDAHEHGVGALNIAMDGTTLAMEFHAPGADIVGFEYAAETSEDRAAIDSAVATLAAPLDLFVLPAAAECSVVQASAELESEGAHEEHDHSEHSGHDEHAKHDEHADHDHGNHDDHAEHDDHENHDDHAEHDGHDAHDDLAGHTEFHAEYTMACANLDALTEITFAYFEVFENAREVEVQILTASGAQVFEVKRDDPTLGLRSLF